MSEQNPKEVLDAATRLIGAVESLVRSAGGAVAMGAGVDGDGLKPTPSDLSRSDSPAYLDFHAEGNGPVEERANAYYDAHSATYVAGDGSRKADPSKGATWKDFARIYTNLFAQSQAFESDGGGGVSDTLKATPFERIRILQSLVRLYDPNDPDAMPPTTFPTPIAWDPAWTMRDCISEFLSLFNTEPSGAQADRGEDGFVDIDGNPIAAATPLRLTHGQVVELYHAFEAQHDLRLLAPYDVNTMVW